MVLQSLGGLYKALEFLFACYLHKLTYYVQKTVNPSMHN